MGINSRAKGNRTERQAAKLLKKWTSFDFTRVPSSGGLRWKKIDNTTGDLVCSDKYHRCPFSFEIKNHKDINFAHSLYLKKNIIGEFWNQCQKDAERGEKIPILFMRYNGLPKNFFFVVLEYKIYRLFKLHLKFKEPHMILSRKLIIFTTTDLFQSRYLRLSKIAKQLIKQKWPRK